jgi:hypothetical protein
MRRHLNWRVILKGEMCNATGRRSIISLTVNDKIKNILIKNTSVEWTKVAYETFKIQPFVNTPFLWFILA